jgi:hypothetical protein
MGAFSGLIKTLAKRGGKATTKKRVTPKEKALSLPKDRKPTGKEKNFKELMDRVNPPLTEAEKVEAHKTKMNDPVLRNRRRKQRTQTK